MTKDKCIFCKIIGNEIGSGVIYENDKILCILDIDPINLGHILILPKDHVLDVDELDESMAKEIMKKSMLMVKVLKRVFDLDGYSIMQNGGDFNDIGHYHMHIFPRYNNDGFSWTYGEIENNKEINENIYGKLKKEISKHTID